MKRHHWITAALVLGGSILAAAVLSARLIGVSVGVFTRDAVTTADVPPYTGAISTLNLMVWFAAGVLSVFVCWITAHERRRLALFALLLFCLAADDALLLHDSVGPHLGVDEKFFYLVYALAALAVARSMVGAEHTTAVAFWSGAVLLAVSAAVDAAFVGLYLLEDGPKLLGALVWFTVPWLTYSTAAPQSSEAAPQRSATAGPLPR